MGEIFERKGPTLQRLFSHAAETLSPILFDELVNNAYSRLTTISLVKKGTQLKNFPYAFYATDVIFQQGNHPSGTMLEGKHYFGAKHKLYGYKTEVLVAPTGLAIDTLEHKPGIISDLVIFHGNPLFHQEGLIKCGDNADITDPSPSTKFPDSCAILMDKRYQDAQEQVQAIILKKKPMANFSQLKMQVGTKQLQVIASLWKIILVI